MKRRTCTRCGRTYPATPEHFWRHARIPGGLDTRCKRCSRRRVAMTVRERFERNIGPEDSNGCWPWLGSTNRAGYGRFTIDGDRMPATRASLIVLRGQTVPAGMDVCHHCDNPPCVNPDHLFVGTRLDNMLDAAAKGRVSPPPVVKGEDSHLSKLTAEQAAEARRLRRAGLGREELAARFGLSVSGITKVLSGASWPDLEESPVTERIYVRSNGAVTADDVREIRRRYAAGESQRQLAREYGVSHPTVHNIVHRKSWQAITEEPA